MLKLSADLEHLDTYKLEFFYKFRILRKLFGSVVQQNIIPQRLTTDQNMR